MEIVVIIVLFLGTWALVDIWYKLRSKLQWQTEFYKTKIFHLDGDPVDQVRKSVDIKVNGKKI